MEGGAGSPPLQGTRTMGSDARTPDSSTSKTPTHPSRRPHVCSYCKASFGRDEHLQRHIRCHTGERKYQCPCGMTFARNDVFVRHMRGCEKGLSDDARRLVHRSKSQYKTKRACDECAKAKAKCDGQQPCSRCRRKSTPCEKTRNGYEDPYRIYSIRDPVTVTAEIEADASPNEVQILHKDNDQLPLEHDYSVPHFGTPSEQSTTAPSDQDNTFQRPGSYGDMSLVMRSDQDYNPAHLYSCYSIADEEALPSEPDPASVYFSSIGSLDYLFHPQNQQPLLSSPPLFPFTQHSRNFAGDGFSLARLDPIEAKCNQVIELLKHSDSSTSGESPHRYITRETMVRSCHLYGKHFQLNMPIIHSPSFSIVEAPPILLLAVILVGACYAEDCIPPEQVTKLTLQLLAVIGAESHERNMQCPPLSTVQAGILISCILSCSRSVVALKSTRICFARNLSMCERACLFEPMERIDYTMLTVEAFDWELWIEQETRRRIACEMFCEDMVHCVFLGRSPDLDPTHFHVILPSYESCWEAKTAAECLHRLQNLPAQIKVSAAMGLLTCWPDTKTPLFEASAFGMHVLVNGLHYLLHQVTQSDIQSTSYSAPSDMETAEVIASLQRDPSGHNASAIADRCVQTRGSPAIRRINNALDSWRTTWDQRNNRDLAREEDTFKGDPLPFWWLAKLYLALHYHARSLRADNEFATARAERPDGSAKTAVQRKIVGWLSGFRGQRSTVDAEAENWLPHLMKPRREKSA